MSDSTDARGALYELKARAVVRATLDVEPESLQSVMLAGGAAVLHADQAWVYLAEQADRLLGRALAFAAQRGRQDVHLMVDHGGGVLARRAAALMPPVHVWRVVDLALQPVEPAPLPVPMQAPEGAEELVAMLRDAAVDVVVEHGVIHGEIRGLEVARVRVDDHGNASLDVGVGRFDQEASALLHGHLPTAEALRHAVELVRAQRRPGADPHPVNRLARDRWLRAQLLEDPSVVALTSLEPVEPPEPRLNIKDPHPAAAVGHDAEGNRVLVVCSVGIDLELIPVTADLVTREAPARVLLATAARDQVRSQQALLSRLAVPAEFVSVEGDWPT